MSGVRFLFPAPPQEKAMSGSREGIRFGAMHQTKVVGAPVNDNSYDNARRAEVELAEKNWVRLMAGKPIIKSKKKEKEAQWEAELKRRAEINAYIRKAYLSGKSHKEIAAAVGITEESSRNAAWRMGLAKLRK